MPISHRNNDNRNCGAQTIAIGQDFFKINGQLWAVENDPDTHGNGQLIASQSYVTVGGKKVILVGDNAYPDNAKHPDPAAASGDSLVTVN